jgi:hypothetical protein
MRRAPIVTKPDQWQVGETSTWPHNAFFSAPARGKTLSNISAIKASNSVIALICPGQSNICNFMDTKYTPTNTGFVHNFNVYDGGVYLADDPLVGGQWIPGHANGEGCWLGQLADELIDNDVCEHVVLAPVGVGSSTIADWSPGGVLYSRLWIAAERLHAAGITPSAFLFQQGENNHGTSQGDYQDAAEAMISAVRARGWGQPWFIAQATRLAGVNDTAVRAAQAALVNNTDIFSLGDFDALTSGTYRQADGTHFKLAGGAELASIAGTAIASQF